MATNIETLVINAQVQDELSAPVDDMRDGVKKLGKEVDKLGDTSTRTTRKTDDLDRSFAKTTKSGAGLAKTVGTGLKTALVTAGLAAVGAGAAVTKFLIDGVKKASDLNETINQSRVIFGKHSKAMEKWAAGAWKSAGMSKQAALEAAAGFGDMFSQLGFTGAQAAKMSKDVVQMAADLGSFKNLPTGEVTEMISAAFRGEYDSLQRVIPNINAARVESEALAMTGKKTAKELSAQEKVAATLAIIHKDGARAAGDFARTSDQLAGSQKKLSAKIDNIQAALGKRLVPAMTTAVTWILDKFLPGAAALAHTLDDNKGKIGLVAAIITAVFLPAIVSAIAAMVTSAASTVGMTAAWILYAAIVNVIRTATIVYTAAQWLLNAALTANPIGLVVIAIAALAAGIVWAYKHSETFRKKISEVWEFIKNTDAWKALTDAIGWVVGKLDAAWDFAKKVAGAIDDVLGKADKLPGGSKPTPGGGGGSWGDEDTSGDTRTRRGYGGSLGRTLGSHAAVNSALGGGYGISNALVGGGGHGHGSGDHQSGRAVDVVGRNLPAYAREVRRRGGYAAVHGEGSGKHVHAVMGDTATSRRGRVVGSDRVGASVHVDSIEIIVTGGGDPQEVKKAVKQAIAELQRDAEEMSDA